MDPSFTVLGLGYDPRMYGDAMPSAPPVARVEPLILTYPKQPADDLDPGLFLFEFLFDFPFELFLP